MEKGGVKHQYGDEHTDALTWTAVTTGAWKSLPFVAASFGSVWYASQKYPAFNKWLGPSGKVALAVSPPMFAWSYFSEVGIGKALEKNLEVQSGEITSDTGNLPLKYRLANFYYENTLLTYIGCVAPMYGIVLAGELSGPKPPGWQFSHALLHTRVLGQAIAVGGLILIFGGREMLKKNGAPFSVNGSDSDEN
uniref:HIG1 domain-containing protein n=1 Tax=Aureoumbra lagunensis TaxID=44058 RepID=A0A7S3NKG0_9STRA|mmetsp:Transcript_20881/g.27086  ORF Transcript_20881/g.27086 Transcript_20881/m.27086 type:complete len:193 (+) Transcript_20881:51-629(+)